jgi:hypothetical protein
MDFMDTDGLFPTGFRLDLYPSVMADWQIKLGNLIVLRVIRIEIIFPVKFAVLIDLTVCCQTNCHGILYHLFV